MINNITIINIFLKSPENNHEISTLITISQIENIKNHAKSQTRES